MALVAHRASGLRHAVGAGARAADNAPAPRPDLRLLETTLAEVKAVQDSLKGHGTEFDTLLNLRARIDPLRDDLGDDPLESGGDAADMPSRLLPPPGTTTVVIPTEPGVETLQETIKVIWEIEGKAP